MAAALSGMLIAGAFVVFVSLAPQPIGSVFFWTITCVRLSWGAVTCWRRTGLAFATAAMVQGALTSVCLAVLAAMGHPFPNLAPDSLVLFAGAVITGPLLLMIESRVNKAKMQQWSAHMEHGSVWDIVSGRDIPRLRDHGA